MHELYINDVNAGTNGVWLEKAPAIKVAKERGTWQTMPGVDGAYFVSDGALEATTLELSIFVDAGRDLQPVIDYLLAARTVRVTPWAWEWEVYTNDCEPEVKEWMEIPGEGFEGTIVYKAKPYRVVWPHVGCNVSLSYDKTETIHNPYGTALPVITLKRGTTMTIGDVVLTVNTAESNAVAVTIDCERRTIDHPEILIITRAGNAVLPVWPVIPHGDTIVTTSHKGYGGTITANWRLR